MAHIPFVGREAELTKLNELFVSNKYECAVIYGRRRVGKTTLIKEFIKGKKAIYFLAREAAGNINLVNFSSDVYAVTAKELKGKAFFSDWERAFDYIHDLAKKERIILVIDEFPYLANGYRPISSIIQAHIDEQFKDSKLFLILCGSSMSFMEEQVLAYKSPLYGRRTAQFKILPFSFYIALPFFQSFDKEEKAVLYGITGGIPEYLNKINPRRSARANIIDLYFAASGHLFEEPSNLLKQELREPATYNGIIEAIAGGASRLHEIAGKCGIESNKCAKYLNSLISLGIVKKEWPITETAASKRSIIF
jgi:AAA+ ATPase superfamily predicted ATPase